MTVRCSVPAKPDNVHRIFSRDISGTGIRLVSPEILPEGGLLDLIIDIPDRDTILLKGEVVWVKDTKDSKNMSKRQFNTGIKFTMDDKREDGRLKDFIHNLARKESENIRRAKGL